MNTSVAPHSTARADHYLPTLDGWRAVAIALVMLGHGMDEVVALMGRLGMGFEPGVARYIGIHGVLVFFGLSGLLITTRLLDEEARHRRIDLPAFYIRRCFRILPATLFCLLGIGVLALAGMLPVSAGRWFSTLLLAANYSTADYSWYLGHFWSLAVEEHFYLLWPALFLVLGATRRRRLAWAVGLACAVALWRAVDFKWQISGTSSSVFMGRTDIRADHLLWGVAVALAWGDFHWRPRLQALLTAKGMAVALPMALLALLLVPAVDWKLKFLLMSVEGMLVPLAILGTLLNAQGRLGRLLESAPLRWMGRLSFSLYLWQQLFLVWTDARIPALEPWQTFPLNLVGVATCAFISYRWVETPCIALGRRWLAARRRAPSAALPMAATARPAVES